MELHQAVRRRIKGVGGSDASAPTGVLAQSGHLVLALPELRPAGWCWQ